MSLPRSYTLPREFKFSRQGRKIIKNEQFVASTNSSDGERLCYQCLSRYLLIFFSSGDVDSCDDNEFDDDDDDKLPISQKLRSRRTNNLNKNRIHSGSPYNNICPNILTQKQYQHYNLRGGNMKVNNLDLINSCRDSRYDIVNQHPTSSRQNLSRMAYFGQKNFNRHETKLWIFELVKLY